MRKIDLEVAAEFLVMASTLLEIKSATLVPRQERTDEDSDASEEDPTDPRYELVQQLLAYKRYKDAANELEDRLAWWSRRFANAPAKISPAERREGGAEGSQAAGSVGAEDPEASDAADAQDPDDAQDAEAIAAAVASLEYDLEDVNVMDLCEAFTRMLESVGRGPSTHDVVYDDTPIALHAEDILDRLRRDGRAGRLSLTEVFRGRDNRSEMVGLFLATLELVRQRKVHVIQPQQKSGQEIVLELRDESTETIDDDTAPFWRDAQTGEIDYEWPSEEIRRRVEKRMRRRSTSPFAKTSASPDATSQGDDDDDVIDLDE